MLISIMHRIEEVTSFVFQVSSHVGEKWKHISRVFTLTFVFPPLQIPFMPPCAFGIEIITKFLQTFRSGLSKHIDFTALLPANNQST